MQGRPQSLQPGLTTDRHGLDPGIGLHGNIWNIPISFLEYSELTNAVCFDG